MQLPTHDEMIRPEWIDANGHMNLAYYMVVFDRAGDVVCDVLGIGWDYRRRTDFSTFAAEAHTVYEREAKEGEMVRVVTRVLAVDDKRVHFFQEMFHAEAGYRIATCEHLSLHVDLSIRRVAPWPAQRRAALEEAVRAQVHLPWPENAGRHVGMPPHKGT